MPKRNKDEYLAAAETAIDEGWKHLAIFAQERSAALLYLIAATDDRIRLASLTDLAFEAQFSVGVRWSIDALTLAIPRIFSACPNEDRSFPLFVTESNYKEGSDLADYAEAYDAAVLAFTNFHQQRYKAFVANHDPRITFAYASDDVEIAELEKRAYEFHENRLEIPEALAEPRLRRFVELRDIVFAKGIRDQGDRVKLTIDNELRDALRQLVTEEIRFHKTDIPEGTEFAGVTYGQVWKVRAALSVLGIANEFLHTSPAVKDIEGGAVSSLSLRAETSKFADMVSEITEMKAGDALAAMSLLTLDSTTVSMGSLGQLLICPNGKEIIMPRAYSTGLRWERNILKSIARNSATRRQYDSFSTQKEGIALPLLIEALHNEGVAAKGTVRVAADGKTITDVDILAFDPRDSCLLVIQHKWLIEPDSVNESKAGDVELERGRQQANIAKTRLANLEYARQLMEAIPETGYSRLEAIVVCRGMEPTGFVTETDIPVVTERWFKEKLQRCDGLGNLYELATQRPDRKHLAKGWEKDVKGWHIAGYEIRLPITVATVEH